ncbi:MAG: hypothetical protein AAB677_03380 [Patescibacteria group bacterium]
MKYGDFTLGQTEALINKIGGVEGALRLLKGEGRVVFDNLPPDDREARFGGAKNVKPKISHLLIPDLIIPATDGRQTLALANEVFTGGVDPDLKNWGCNLPDEARPETAVNVHELIADATFQQMFGEEGVGLDEFCLTQGQIIKFVTEYREHLHPQGYATFFLFKSHGEFFVGRVSWVDAGRRLKVNVNRLSNGDVWNASGRRRLVLPRLPL